MNQAVTGYDGKGHIGVAGICLVLLFAAGCASFPSPAAPIPGPSAVISPKEPSSSPVAKTDSVATMLAKARNLEKHGEWDQALVAYQEAAKKAPSREEIIWKQAQACDRLEKFDQGAELYRKALERQKDKTKLAFDEEHNRFIKRRCGQMETLLSRPMVGRKRPGDWPYVDPDKIVTPADLRRSRKDLGWLLARTGQPDAALEQFLKAGLDEADAHANVALALIICGQKDEAQVHYDLASAAEPTSAASDQGLRKIQKLMSRSHVPEPTETEREIELTKWEQLLKAAPPPQAPLRLLEEAFAAPALEPEKKVTAGPSLKPSVTNVESAALMPGSRPDTASALASPSAAETTEKPTTETATVIDPLPPSPSNEYEQMPILLYAGWILGTLVSLLVLCRSRGIFARGLQVSVRVCYGGLARLLRGLDTMAATSQQAAMPQPVEAPIPAVRFVPFTQ